MESFAAAQNTKNHTILGLGVMVHPFITIRRVVKKILLCIVHLHPAGNSVLLSTAGLRKLNIAKTLTKLAIQESSKNTTTGAGVSIIKSTTFV